MHFDDTVRLRRTILWIMLGALAVSALLAVLGVMTSRFDQEFRMIGTGISAAVASGLLLAACKLLESEKSRHTSLVLMAIIVFEFLLALLGFWNPSTGQFSQMDEEFVLTAACFPLAALPAALFFHIRQFPGGKIAGWIGMGMSGVAFVAFMRANWASYLPVRQTNIDEYWGSGWACWLFAFVGAATTAGFGADRRHWRWIGFAAALLAFFMGLHGIWHEPETSSNFFIISGTLALLIGHINVLWLCKLKRSQEWLRFATAIVACIAAICFDEGTIEQRGAFDFIWRCGMAAGICAGCGTVAIAILTAFNRRVANSASNSGTDLIELPLVCPCCHRKQTISLRDGIGESACGGCGMIYSIRVCAPRCASCGYLLLMFHGNRCPECGTTITTVLAASPALIAGQTGESC